MRLLLDTHTFIWWVTEPENLSPNALKACEDENNELVLSVVSIWEMQIKMQLGKLKLHLPLRDLIIRQLNANDMQLITVTIDHVLALDNLPSIHKDPFDRMLIAQSIAEEAIIISKDIIFQEYSVKLLW